MNNTELERAKELKHRLDVAWKQCKEFSDQLEEMGFDIKLYNGSPCMFERLTIDATPQADLIHKVVIRKTEVIEL